MNHNPNSQDEMAANKYAADQGDDCLCQRTQPGTPVGEHIHIFCGCRLAEAFLTGCKHKTEQLSNGSVSFDEEAVLEEAALACFGQRDATRCVSHNFIKVARWQHAQLAPIINAQAERLKAAEGLIEKLEKAIERALPPEAYGPKAEGTAVGNLVVSISEIVKFRKGEG